MAAAYKNMVFQNCAIDVYVQTVQRFFSLENLRQNWKMSKDPNTTQQKTQTNSPECNFCPGV